EEQFSGHRGWLRWIALPVPPLALALALGYWLANRKESAGTIDFTQALRVFYIISAALFILGLKGLSSPKYARKGMFLAELGMAMAVVGTLFHHDIVSYRWI